MGGGWDTTGLVEEEKLISYGIVYQSGEGGGGEAGSLYYGMNGNVKNTLRSIDALLLHRSRFW